VIVLPVNKKAHWKDPNNYRRMNLVNSGYKIYTTILNEKLKR
jgi:hypothetical protein